MHIILIICFFKIALADILIQTTNGPIRGVASLVDDVEAFLGIPYAEPPIGDLRFKKPVPAKNWEEIYNATSLPPPCSQYRIEPQYFLPDVTNMSEDCLYLNIWIPKANSDRLRPVVIFIHSGSFSAGSSCMRVHDGSHLASRGDLVVVTINYRVGSFGYYLAYTEDANGNMGMYDQIMAMKWVKDNAVNFGGDPENIVLLGSSAGAFSITGHMVSPLSKNLFNKAIMQSGSLLHPYLMDNNTRIFRNSEKVASIVGCTKGNITLKNNPHTVVKCLKSKSKEIITEAERILLLTNAVAFYPRVNDEFLPKSPVDLFREGKFRKDIDILMGITPNEGSLFLPLAIPEYFGHYGRSGIQNISKTRAKTILRAAFFLTSERNPMEIIDYYIKIVKNESTFAFKQMIANFLGDYVIACNTVFSADFLSLKGNPVYFYKFGFRSHSTPMAEWVGTTHLDEVQYVFGNPYHENFTPEEIKLSHLLMDRWSRFARTGNPNIPGHMPWLRYSYHNPLYLNFGQEEESIRRKPNKRCEIWRKRFKADITTDLIHFLRHSEADTTQ